MANKLKEKAKNAENAKKQAEKVYQEAQKLSAENHVYNNDELLKISEGIERSCEQIIKDCNILI